MPLTNFKTNKPFEGKRTTYIYFPMFYILRKTEHYTIISPMLKDHFLYLLVLLVKPYFKLQVYEYDVTIT